MLSPLDYVLLHLGNPGRYQLFVAFLLYCLQLPITFSNGIWKYYTEEPPHRCLIRGDLLNGTTSNEWIPVQMDSSNVKSFSSCRMYIDVHNHWKGTQRCSQGWEYRPPEGELNIVSEWDLVCENRWLLDLLFYMANMTAISGGIFFGLISDHFERKRSLLVSLYFFLATAFFLHFVQDYLSFALTYSLQSFFVTGVTVVSYVLLMELFPTPYQVQVSVFFIAFGLASSLLLPLLMWVIKSWRYVQLAVSAPGVVFLAHIWLLPQSPLWLTFEGKMLAAENLIEQLAQSNGKLAFPPSFRLHLRNLFNSVKGCTMSYATRHRLLPKFSSPCLRWYFLVHFYLFFVLGLTSDVVDTHVLRLNENKYADHFYRGLIDCGVVIFVYYFATRLGPRSVQSILFIFSGLLMMASITLHETLPKENEMLESTSVSRDFDYRILLVPSTLVSASKALLKTLPALVWYHAVKTLPTGIRTSGFACCFAWTIAGHMASPNLLILADLLAPFIPLGLCGSLCVIGGGLSLLFPSCWRRPLPNTVEEAENKALIPIKDRYPSFRDLSRTGKLASLAAASPAPSNVYSLPPNAAQQAVGGNKQGNGYNNNVSVDNNIASPNGSTGDGRRHVTQSYTLNHDLKDDHQNSQECVNGHSLYFTAEHYEVTPEDIQVDDNDIVMMRDGNWRLVGGDSSIRHPTATTQVDNFASTNSFHPNQRNDYHNSPPPPPTQQQHVFKASRVAQINASSHNVSNGRTQYARYHNGNFAPLTSCNNVPSSNHQPVTSHPFSTHVVLRDPTHL